MAGIDEQIAHYSFWVVGYAILLLVGLSLLSLRIKHPSKMVKRFLFLSIVLATIVPTLFLSISTIYLNVISSSKGPVHWHADFEIWACNKEYELVDPKGLSNKIGTNVLHEHNDKRIHLEGVVVNKEDASLGKFIEVVGGKLSASELSLPTTMGKIVFDSYFCGSTPLELQFFVYKTDKEGYYTQKKLTDPASYIISPFSAVPPGDCIIIELDNSKEKSKRMCESYQAALMTGKLKGERL